MSSAEAALVFIWSPQTEAAALAIGFLCAKMKKAALIDVWGWFGKANPPVNASRAG